MTRYSAMHWLFLTFLTAIGILLWINFSAKHDQASADMIIHWGIPILYGFFFSWIIGLLGNSVDRAMWSRKTDKEIETIVTKDGTKITIVTLSHGGVSVDVSGSAGHGSIRVTRGANNSHADNGE